MSYRGEDLDLRTPQTWSGTPADLAAVSDPSGPRNGYRVTPLFVDETVLACSNHAFDIAVAHRAGEVRLEHLLHALTRIDAAAEALEGRGVRVAALRRETATIIASEIPVGLPNGKGMPRRSDEFAEVLRLASLNAARRNAPASIEDVLFVLLDQRSELPGLSLLARHLSRLSGRDAIEPLPPLTRYSTEPRYAPAADRYGRVSPADMVRYTPEASRLYRSEYSGTPTDNIQNSRIEALEQMVRALSNDLAGERQVVSGLLKDLSRDTQASRDDQGRLQSGLFDRIQDLEQAVTQTRFSGTPDTLVEKLETIEMALELRLQEMSQSWALLSTRLQDLEIAVRQTVSDKASSSQLVDRFKQAIDLTPVTNRLDIIEEALLSGEPRSDGDVADRLKRLEGEITRVLAAQTAGSNRMEALMSGFDKSGGTSVAGPALERVVSLASSYQTHQVAANELSEKLLERMTAVEQALAAEIGTAAAKHQAYAHDLTEVHDALMKLNQNQHTLAGSIDQWRTESAGDVAVMSTRLANLDRDTGQPAETLQALSASMDNMNRLMIERYHRRNRFWYWLFGTDDWIGSSWPSQAAAIESERQKLKASTSA
jgi:Clp amino terminal domain, pathogenicity island component